MKFEHTTTADIAAELIHLRVQAGAVTLGRVATLIVVVPDEEAAEQAITIAGATSRAHPCRVVVIVHDDDTAEAACEQGLDAEVRVGASEGASEVVILYPQGQACEALDTLVMPLLVPDTPVVVWWPQQAPASPGEHPLGELATRRITDSRQVSAPVEFLHQLALNYHPGDTDLAWAAVTLWRALAVTLVEEGPHYPITSARLCGNTNGPAIHLLAAWLAVQLDVDVTTEHADVATVTEMILTRDDGDLVIRRTDGESVATLSHPARVDQQVNLPRRSVSDCLTEDLRRLDPDDMYAEALTRGLARVDRTWVAS